MKYLIFFASLLFGYFILFICILIWVNPYYTDFGNGYYVSSDKDYGVDDLIYEYPKNSHLSRTICFYDTFGNIDTMIISPKDDSKIILGQHVSPIVADNDFILLQRKPKDVFHSLYLSALKSDSLAYRGFNNDYDYSFRYLFTTNEYWIINKQSNSVYGPLTLTQYYLLRDQLGVSERLRLPFEDQWLKIKNAYILIKIILILILPLLFSILLVFFINKYQRKS